MGLTTGLAIYFIIWWLVLFTVLPWGAKSHYEAETEFEPGTAPSAPVKPRIGMKFAITLVFALVYRDRDTRVCFLTSLLDFDGYKLITLDSIPFLPPCGPQVRADPVIVEMKGSRLRRIPQIKKARTQGTLP